MASGFNIWHIAVDTATGNPVPFEEIRSAFAESIRAAYPVPPDELDPIGWAATSRAHEAFFKLHPEIKLTYH